jgi:hypothetical protein
LHTYGDPLTTLPLPFVHAPDGVAPGAAVGDVVTVRRSVVVVEGGTVGTGATVVVVVVVLDVTVVDDVALATSAWWCFVAAA